VGYRMTNRSQPTFWDGFWRGTFWGGAIGLPIFAIIILMRLFL
jgi:hypothetical protein